MFWIESCLFVKRHIQNKESMFLLKISYGCCGFWQKEFLDKYESFAQLVAKIYPTETIPTVVEMRDLLASM